jgi:metal-responsive CopG/Arc/MetJ family transcriptional regulator
MIAYLLEYPMARHKTAIAIPEDLLQQVDAAARERNESRSAFITRILQAAMRAHRDREITRRLDELFADEVVRRAQLEPAELADEVLGDESW